MADYRVNLDIFAGPLDLLLYLVRKEEVEIYDIPIAKITDQYIRYIEMLKSLDIDLAGDFLVMAATLMQIKSAMLLPRAEPEQLQDEDFSDPRAELIRQLLEYKKFKDAANQLNAIADEHRDRFPRPDTIIEHLKGHPNAIEGVWDAQLNTGPEYDIERVSVWDLLEAFDSVCKAVGDIGDISHIKDDTPIDLYQIEILHRLQAEGPMTFERIFETSTTRIAMVGLFLALLELIRENLVWVEQPVPSSIYIRSLTNESPEQAVQKAIIDLDSSQQISAQAPKKHPPIPISEIPPESKPSVSSEELRNEEMRRE